MKKRYWFWDLETLNIFTATFIDRDSDDTRVFVMSDNKNQRKEMLDFLDEEVEGLIGYNSLFFDAQVLEYIIRNPYCKANEIRKYAQLITSEDNRKPDVPSWKLKHKHLDLFRALSLSVKAKRTSLKWCQYMLDLENIEDMPSQGEGDNWEEQVLAYNKNDVIATKALYFKQKHEIELRNSRTREEGVDLMNSTEPDISKKLFAKYLSQTMGIFTSDLRTMGTDRPVVNVKDIIFPYVKFLTKDFNDVKKRFELLSLKEYDTFDFVLRKQGIDITYGLGGIHAAPKNKIIESDEDYVIKSFDATSYYPHLCFQNDLCPAHLPKHIFLPLYRGMYEQRQAIPKKDPRNYILKICLNALYGMTNDKFSFLRDRLVTLAICINGQLLLSMLTERILEEIPNSQLVMMNTDGCEILIPRKYEEKYQEICKWWEELTRIPLEHIEYQKLIIKDCNNYIGIFADPNIKPKCKGSFEFQNIPLHKNKSHNIIPIAIYEYFVNNKPIEETIKNHTNIFDFCAGVRARSSDKKGKSYYTLKYIEDNIIKEKKLSKTVRYFISNKGQTLYKIYGDGSQSHVEAPINLGGKRMKHWKVTYFNKAFFPKDFKEYDIDYSYYIHKAREIIISLEGNVQQTTLF